MRQTSSKTWLTLKIAKDVPRLCRVESDENHACERKESERAEWSGSARQVLEYFGTRAAGMASSKREEGMKEANIPAAYAAEGDAPRACKS